MEKGKSVDQRRRQESFLTNEFVAAAFERAQSPIVPFDARPSELSHQVSILIARGSAPAA